MTHASHLTPYLFSILNVSLTGLVFDPNYCQVEEEEEAMEVDSDVSEEE